MSDWKKTLMDRRNAARTDGTPEAQELDARISATLDELRNLAISPFGRAAR